MLFVNAGVTNDPTETIADVATDEFVRVMVTNALSPMRVIESLQDLVVRDGPDRRDVVRPGQHQPTTRPGCGRYIAAARRR